MTVHHLSRVLDLKMPQGQKMVLLVYANHANDQDHCWPSRKTVALVAACSVETVRNYLKVWRDLGIMVEVDPGGGKRKTTLYQLDLDAAGARYGLLELPSRGPQKREAERAMSAVSYPVTDAVSDGAEDPNRAKPVSYPVTDEALPGNPVAHKPSKNLHLEKTRACDADRPQGSAPPPRSPGTAGAAAEGPSLAQRMRDLVATWRAEKRLGKLADLLDEVGKRWCVLAWEPERLVLGCQSPRHGGAIAQWRREVERGAGVPDGGLEIEILDQTAWGPRGRFLAAEAAATVGYDAEALAAEWAVLIEPLLRDPKTGWAKTWLAGAGILWLDGRRVCIACPTKFIADHLAKNHREELARFLGREVMIEAPAQNIWRARGLALARKFWAADQESSTPESSEPVAADPSAPEAAASGPPP